MYSCIIIDDEQHAIEGLKPYVRALPLFNLVSSYTDPVKALFEISKGDPVDLILMDIDMPRLTGIELSKIIRNKTKWLVFTTAHSKYAFEAFEVKANAFLLKPYNIGKFITTINELIPDHVARANETRLPEFFFVKSKNDNLTIFKVKFIDVIAVEGKDNNIIIHTVSKKITTYMSLSEIALTLAKYSDFIHLHRSFIVSKTYIQTINGSKVTMKNGLQITVSDSCKKEFSSFVTERMIKGKKPA